MFYYAPAVSEQILNIIRFADIYQLNWWLKWAPFQHHALLYNAYSYYFYQKFGEHYKDLNFLQLIGFPTSYLFIMDSGGWELYNNSDNEELIKILTPQKILSIQEAMADFRTADTIGMILDIVPYQKLPHELFHYSPLYFLEAMEETARNTEIAIDKHKRNLASKLKLYGVLQGKEPEHLEWWYKRMKRYEDKLDGWAVSPKADYAHEKLAKVFMYIVFILENEIKKPIHFLGVSSRDCLALIIYFTKYHPRLVTADSAGYDYGARKLSIIGTDPSICSCPMTTLHTYRFHKKYGGVALSIHNLYWQKIFIEELIKRTENPEKYIEFVLANCNKGYELLVYFKQIDEIIAKKRKKILLVA